MSAPTDPAAGAGPRPQAHAAVLFADIAGSTTLYETLGDSHAKSLVDECLHALRTITARHGGRVVKTIGDELMCVFPDADRVTLAACEMQQAVSALPVVSNVQRAIRIGFHAGPVLEADGDVFGDTVNTAARMAGFAKAKQVITTQAAVAQMSALLRATTRHIAALSVRGKGDDVVVCEVLWQGTDDLTMATASMTAAPAASTLELTHGPQRLLLDGANARAVLGRDVSCHIVLADRKASRVHARIERRRDKYFLVDQSTNGTYVSFTGEAEIALRREEVMLRGAGRIVFGHSIAESADETVDFRLT
ncbi:MAG: adenylate/guanylate cyclase domain-containing protein [Burkholderiales bacterium]|nr:adenylate/guanylate cyclase domain-containing protein [Burkholderiales bacterium]